MGINESKENIETQPLINKIDFTDQEKIIMEYNFLKLRELIHDCDSHLKYQQLIEYLKIRRYLSSSYIQNMYSSYPLHWILQKESNFRNEEIVSFLLENGYNPNLLNNDGNTPLHISIGHVDNFEMRYIAIKYIELLFKHGAYLNLPSNGIEPIDFF